MLRFLKPVLLKLVDTVEPRVRQELEKALRALPDSVEAQVIFALNVAWPMIIKALKGAIEAL